MLVNQIKKFNLYAQVLDHLNSKIKQNAFNIEQLMTGLGYDPTDLASWNKIFDVLYVMRNNRLVIEIPSTGFSSIKLYKYVGVPDKEQAESTLDSTSKPVEVTSDDNIKAEVLKEISRLSSDLGNLYYKIEQLGKTSRKSIDLATVSKEDILREALTRI